MSSRLFRIILGALGIGAVWSMPVQASILWNGSAGNGVWFDSGNWAGGAVPSAADTAVIDYGGVAAIESAAASADVIGVGYYGGVGSLSIASGGSLATTDGYLGAATGDQGTLTITGAGALWQASGTLYVGYGGGGVGMLSVSNGGALESAQALIGNLSNASGFLTLSGAGTTWNNSGDIVVGNQGSGSLTIENNARVENDKAFVGYENGASGTVLVDQAQWINTDNLSLGTSGQGQLTIQNGGLVQDSKAFLGLNSNGVGLATITGSGSRWVHAANLAVGNDGQGTLDLSAGGAVEDVTGFIGFSSTAQGTVTVDGSETRWTNTGNLSIAESGQGTLTVRNGGLVAFETGYIGDLGGSTGVVTVTGAASSLQGNQQLYVGYGGTGSLIVAAGAQVSVAGAITIAAQSGSTGTLALGGASGSAAAAPGTLRATSLVFGAGSGTLVFNHTSSSYDFSLPLVGQGTVIAEAGDTILSGDLSGFSGNFDLAGGAISFATATTTTLSGNLSGNGALTLSSGKTILSGDSSSYTGSVSVNNGATLSVNGALGGVTQVETGGRLQGGGTMGDVVLDQGSTVAPGNSIGTLTVSGDLTMAGGAIYEVEADATHSDKMEVSGTASLQNGSLVELVAYQGASLKTGTPYTILTAAGGVSGQFDNVQFASNYLFLSPSLQYDPYNVYLTIARNATPYATYAVDHNQASVAQALEALSSDQATAAAFMTLANGPQATRALQDLTGEIYANTRLSDLAQSFEASARISDHFETPVVLPQNGPLIWGQAFGGAFTRDGGSQAARAEKMGQGFLLGVEAAIDTKTRFGYAFSYENAEEKVKAEDPAYADTNAFDFHLYGQRQWSAVSLRGDVSYGWLEKAVKRSVVVGSLTDSLSSSYHAHRIGGFGEASYNLSGHEKAKLAPFARLAYSALLTPDISETGGDAALFTRHAETSLGQSLVGLRAARDLSYGRISSMIGWAHRIGDTMSKTNLAFENGPTFQTDAAPLARDAATAQIGFDIDLGAASHLGLLYQGAWSALDQTRLWGGAFTYRF